MKTLLTAAVIFASLSCSAQKDLDTKIIVTMSDTAGLYEKIRMAFVKSDFIVKDDRNPDTLTTYPAHIKSTTYIKAFAALKNNTVTLWGYLGDSHGNLMGATVNPSAKDYKKIYYYKRDKYWNKLLSVAKMLGGSLSYSH
ncbi:MAG: hypothetical protein JWQ27_2687 [Ferruginibacter sp.]|nr:hypothetical protein [Ferruginibacter sp.]